MYRIITSPSVFRAPSGWPGPDLCPVCGYVERRAAKSTRKRDFFQARSATITDKGIRSSAINKKSGSSLFAIDHPWNTVSIDQHSKASSPKSLLDWHPHRAFICQSVKNALACAGSLI